ncbi:MAG: hypothetical protein ACK5HP_05100 [Bacilli bacterium]
MELIFPNEVLNILMIASTLSVITMALIQKLKKMNLITTKKSITIVNVLASLIIGIPYTMHFYNLSLVDGLFVSFFSFIGAPLIYDSFKKNKV